MSITSINPATNETLETFMSLTKDITRGRRVAERIETGMIFVNQPTNSQAELLFGGMKNSGYERERSH